jgi:hypothetical protein
MESASGNALPPPPPYVGDFRKAPSPLGALALWFVTVFIFSALAVVGPLVIPLAHTGKANMNVSFGKGELLGFALALFAATLSRWIGHEGKGRATLWSLSTLGLALAAAAIAVVWLDGYEVHIGQEKDLFIPTSSVVVGSWILVGASFVCGAIGEIMYARSLRPTPVTLW